MPAYKTLSVYICLPQFTPKKLTVIILKWCGLYVLCDVYFTLFLSDHFLPEDFAYDHLHIFTEIINVL